LGSYIFSESSASKKNKILGDDPNFVPHGFQIVELEITHSHTTLNKQDIIENSISNEGFLEISKTDCILTTRDKYFRSSSSAPGGTGVNRIKTTVNPTLGSTPFEDQVVVILMNPGTAQQLGVGNLITFQDPDLSGGKVNLTGGTINQFQNNSITGTTTTGITTTTITYADPSDPNGQNSANATIFINSPQVSQFPVIGNTTVEQSFLQYHQL
jgi:hypothetical protein